MLFRVVKLMILQKWKISLFSLALLLCSCGNSREDQLYGNGTGAFFIFALLIIQTFALNRLYKYEWFQKARNSMRKVLSPFSVLGVFAGSIILIIGFRSEGLD